MRRTIAGCNRVEWLLLNGGIPEIPILSTIALTREIWREPWKRNLTTAPNKQCQLKAHSSFQWITNLPSNYEQWKYCHNGESFINFSHVTTVDICQSIAQSSPNLFTEKLHLNILIEKCKCVLLFNLFHRYVFQGSAHMETLMMKLWRSLFSKVQLNFPRNCGTRKQPMIMTPINVKQCQRSLPKKLENETNRHNNLLRNVRNESATMINPKMARH